MRPSMMAVQPGCSWVQKAMAKPSYKALRQQTQLGPVPSGSYMLVGSLYQYARCPHVCHTHCKRCQAILDPALGHVHVGWGSSQSQVSIEHSDCGGPPLQAVHRRGDTRVLQGTTEGAQTVGRACVCTILEAVDLQVQQGLPERVRQPAVEALRWCTDTYAISTLWGCCDMPARASAGPWSITWDCHSNEFKHAPQLDPRQNTTTLFRVTVEGIVGTAKKGVHCKDWRTAEAGGPSC